MKKRLIALLLALCAILMCMAGCAGDGEADVANSNTPESSSPATEAPATEAPVTESAGGGILRVALPSASPFSGVFNMVYCIEITDATIAYWITEPILSIDDDLRYDQDGPATYTYDMDAKTMTLTMKSGVKWHDGEPVTMEDLIFAYEVLASPDYDGAFFTEMLTYVEGLSEYKDGTADTISGFELSEDKNTLTIHFDKFAPSVLEGGIWTYPMPKHQFVGVDVADMAADERSRAKAIGYGPFMISNVVEGESVELVRFDDYWQGQPKLDGVTLTVVNPDMLPSAMEQELYDVSLFPAEAYADHADPEVYSYFSAPDRWYQFTGFRLGRFDYENGENIFDPDSKMNDLNLRRAIGYAVDLESVCLDYYNGLRGLNPTVLPPDYAQYQNPDVTGYSYDPEKASALLDEAGYIDLDGDGLREGPDGEPFVINWGVPNTNDETVVQFKLQCWRDAGLDVQLVSGRLMDTGAFYDMLFQDDPGIDMFEMGWIIETTPNLEGAWGRYALVNFSRFASDEMDVLLAAIDSEEAWDDEVRVQAYYDFESYFFEMSPAIPTVWRANLYAVNNRVSNYSIIPVQIENTRHLIELATDA